jgi:hypothetical protein
MNNNPNHPGDKPMQTSTAKSLCLAGATLVVLSFQSPARPQGSGSSRAAPPRATRPPTPEEFYQSFWKHLNRKESPYTQWSGFAGKEGMQKGESPHGTFTKTFINKTAADDPQKLPYGAILVTENYADDEKTLQNITVMYRYKGSDPKHNDWYWLKYQPDGTIARTPEKEGKKAIAGKVASCIDCHTRAGGADFVFSNDEKAEEEKTGDEKSPDKELPDEK